MGVCLVKKNEKMNIRIGEILLIFLVFFNTYKVSMAHWDEALMRINRYLIVIYKSLCFPEYKDV